MSRLRLQAEVVKLVSALQTSSASKDLTLLDLHEQDQDLASVRATTEKMQVDPQIPCKQT